MKKTVIAAALLLLTLSAGAQEVSYSLPKTTITVEVGYAQDIIHAGKYAKYAKDLLGLEVQEKDTVITSITQLKIAPRVEADQSRRYSLNLTGNTRPALLALTEQGLVAGSEKEFNDNGGSRHAKNSLGRQINYRKPEKPAAGKKPVRTFYEERIITVKDSLGNDVPDTILVEIEPVDSLLIEAQDAAKRIKQYREQRYKILIGDTDASYSGEAMGAAIAELSRLEGELLPLFEGKIEQNKGRAYFDVIPDSDGLFPVFAIDPVRGPVKATNSIQNVFNLMVKAEPVEDPSPIQSKKQPSQKIIYRIPAICELTLLDGPDEIMSLRAPVYQLGLETTYPLYD
ncbi:MAG: DUF4831 family protein [Bacteroidales bacterium]|nr:DUF4831 family protein [Bacteroidales bacterium]